MLILKAYTVMDTLALEVTCYHPPGTGESHLLIRETTTGLPCGLSDALNRLGDVCHLESRLRKELGIADDPACLQQL